MEKVYYTSPCVHIYMYIVYNLRGIYVHCMYVVMQGGKALLKNNVVSLPPPPPLSPTSAQEEPQLHRPVAAASTAGGEDGQTDACSLRPGEGSPQEPLQRPTLAGVSQDGSARREKEHRSHAHGQGDARVHLVWDIVGGVNLPGATPTEEDQECGRSEEVRARSSRPTGCGKVREASHHLPPLPPLSLSLSHSVCVGCFGWSTL